MTRHRSAQQAVTLVGHRYKAKKAATSPNFRTIDQHQIEIAVCSPTGSGSIVRL